MSESFVQINLKGRVDSNNAPQVEQEIMGQLEGKGGVPVVIDMEELEYISSAGLRVLLRVKKTNSDLTIKNVNSEVYEILDMTGFTEMMTVEKAYRVVSVEGCEEIGRGANGTIYRIDQDNVVKVYNNADALDDIQHEREVARIALILGIPTAISYDVVKVGESYGSVFELLNAKSFSKILETEPEKLDWCVNEFVEMLKKIHSTQVPEGKLPAVKETAVGWAEFMKDYLPEEAAEKLINLVKEVPDDDHMIHGDYHTKNLELQNDEVLLIDMDTLAVGHPIFEFGSMYNSFIGYGEVDHSRISDFLGFPFETSVAFFRKALSAYLGTNCALKLKEVEDKARVIGYTRMIRRSIRRNGLESEEGRKEIEFWKSELLNLLDNIDTLTFSKDELELYAELENLPEVQKFLDEHLEAADCPMKVQMQLSVAVEEIFANIANYAYGPNRGKARIRIEVAPDPLSVTITFIDQGMQYDPLAKEDPDITLSAEERPIGGLGIFITKKTMDDVVYEYKDGQNILTLKKNL